MTNHVILLWILEYIYIYVYIMAVACTGKSKHLCMARQLLSSSYSELMGFENRRRRRRRRRSRRRRRMSLFGCPLGMFSRTHRELSLEVPCTFLSKRDFEESSVWQNFEMMSSNWFPRQWFSMPLGNCYCECSRVFGIIFPMTAAPPNAQLHLNPRM